MTEVKTYTALRRNKGKRKGQLQIRRQPASVRVICLLRRSLTEEETRLKNMGCDMRGHRSDGVFSHGNGKGWVLGGGSEGGVR